MKDKIVLKVKGISKSYQSSFRRNSYTLVVDNLSFNLDSGEVYGLIGPNGAGKTTTVKMLVDLIKPDSGEIEIFDSPPSSLELKNRIGFMPENPQFYNHLTAYEFLSFIGRLFRLVGDQLDKRVVEVLRLTGLIKDIDRPIKGFSKGMKQRLGFAQSLINDPELLFLDEPFDGLDPIGRIDFKNLLLEMKRQSKTILFSSHILSDVEAICDTIGLMHQGKLIAAGPIKSLISQSSNLEEFFVEKIGSSG